jgi:hypothetical protein
LDPENDGNKLPVSSPLILVYKEQLKKNKEIPVTQINITGI